VAISIPDRVVVFDYGEVISRTPSTASQEALLALAGVEAEPFLASYERHRHALDQGRLSVVDYWRTIEREAGGSWDFARLQQLWAVDFTRWFEPEPEVVALIGELHDGGTRLAILSNAGFDFGDPFRRAPLGSVMERVVVSAELDLIKPDPEIYRRAMAELGTDPAHTAFIDNKRVNVEAAAALGIAAHHFTGADGLRAFLEELAA